MATKTPARKPNPPRSRSEVQREFESVAKDVIATEAVDPKRAEATSRRAQEVRETVQGIAVDDVIQRTTALGIEISRTLSTVTEKLRGKIQELEDVTEAVELQKQELERLHKIDIAQTAIDALVLEHQTSMRELTNEMTETRATWVEEQSERERRRKEEDAALAQARQREKEEYEYKKLQERSRAEDEFRQKLMLQQRANEEKQRELEKGWTEREATLKGQEAEVSSMREQVVGFEARLKNEIKQAVEGATTALRAQITTEHTLKLKDMETDKRISEAKIKSFEELVARQNEQIVRLQGQLEAAKEQVQDIAVKAIEGASKRDALDQLMQVARERDGGINRNKA